MVRVEVATARNDPPTPARLTQAGLSVAPAGQDGRFKIEGLPEGDYLVAAARSAPQRPDPEFLELLRASAVPFSLADGESKELVLRPPIRPPLPRRPGLNN